MKKFVPGWTVCLLTLPLSLSFISKAMGGVVVLEVSSSKKSIMIDQGAEIHNIYPGQLGKFYVQESVDFPHTSLVAEGEAIKVHENYSYWYLKNVQDPKALERGKQLEFFSEGETLRGRTDIDVEERRVVLTDDQSEEDEHDFERLGVPSKVIKKEGDYLSAEENVKTSFPKGRDVRMTTYGKWDGMKSEAKEDLSGEVVSKNSSLLGEKAESVQKKKVAREYRKEIFESSTDGLNTKINAHADPLLALYGNRKNKKTGFELEPAVAESTYSQTKLANERARIILEEDVEKIDKDDPRWSQEMTDKQLRRFFVESNIEREVNRQRFAFSNYSNHEVLLRYIAGMTQKTNPNDEANQGTAQGVDLSYEYHLIRLTESLQNWTAEVGGSTGYNFYDTEVYNARSYEQLMHLALNWYPTRGPSYINGLTWHIGVGGRFGSAELESENFTRAYGYQLSSQYVQLGMKYRFSGGDDRTDILKFGMGINGLICAESIKLASNEPIDDAEVAGNVTTTDMKFLLGVSFFF